MTLAVILLALVLSLLAVERCVLAWSIRRIPLRILVTGTRGKSTVCRLISAGLTSSDRRCLAKVTGGIPTLIHPDRSEEYLHRKGPARIQEQFRTLWRAARSSVDAIVLESMSVSPELQLIEQRYLAPTIFVLTNVRLDHSEHVDRSITSHMEALTSGIPNRAVVVTGEFAHLDPLKEIARKREWDLYLPGFVAGDHSTSSNSGIDVNVNIALEVCRLAGCDTVQIKRILEDLAATDPHRPFRVQIGTQTHLFLNAFEANDVESTRILLKAHHEQFTSFGDPVFLLNTRFDRPYRSIELARWVARDHPRSRVIVTGSHRIRAYHELRRNGFEQSSILLMNPIDTLSVSQTLEKMLKHSCALVGIGNIAGAGHRIVDIFQQLAISPEFQNDH